MRTISKSKLKANMLKIFRELEAKHEELTVTDHGVPVLKIVPIQQKQSMDELFGPYQGQIVFHEDPDTPTSDEWSEV
ncbi:MAG: type II toxin-antitoxin system Phd/YefM family antitoxin [Anaerolineales bacterium]|nr:type II toxin-antitoxin system Phd/YefM family antitoxin [Anaerolineales bacterium]